MADRIDAAAARSPSQVASAILGASPTAARLAVTLVDIGPGTAVLELTVGEDMVNGYGICHGGVVFTLAELACLVAASSGDRAAVATGATIELISAAPLGAVLRASSRPVAERGRQSVHDVEVTDGPGTVVALLRGRTRILDGPAVSDGTADG